VLTYNFTAEHVGAEPGVCVVLVSNFTKLSLTVDVYLTSFVSHYEFCSQKTATVRSELILTINGGWCCEIAHCT